MPLSITLINALICLLLGTTFYLQVEKKRCLKIITVALVTGAFDLLKCHPHFLCIPNPPTPHSKT